MTGREKEIVTALEAARAIRREQRKGFRPKDAEIVAAILHDERGIRRRSVMRVAARHGFIAGLALERVPAGRRTGGGYYHLVPLTHQDKAALVAHDESHENRARGLFQNIRRRLFGRGEGTVIVSRAPAPSKKAEEPPMGEVVDMGTASMDAEGNVEINPPDRTPAEVAEAAARTAAHVTGHPPVRGTRPVTGRIVSQAPNLQDVPRAAEPEAPAKPKRTRKPKPAPAE